MQEATPKIKKELIDADKFYNAVQNIFKLQYTTKFIREANVFDGLNSGHNNISRA